MKREAELKAKLMKELRSLLPGYVHQRHEDRFSSGWPDISVSGNGKTSWWEVKHADPKWASKGIQELTCLRLAVTSFCCRYIFYHEREGVKRTLIVHPNNLRELLPEAWCNGFNQRWLAEYIREVHA